MPRIDIDVSTLQLARPVRVELDGAGIVVVMTGEGIYAFEDVCPHARWRLSEGELVDGLLECPGHGWQFHLSTGRCADVPDYRLKPVRVTRFGNTLQIEVPTGVPDPTG
jgi:3-phenylpropionate/trans-cinnamate dioxygenase ferredoxin subunit